MTHTLKAVGIWLAVVLPVAFGWTFLSAALDVNSDLSLLIGLVLGGIAGLFAIAVIEDVLG